MPQTLDEVIRPFQSGDLTPPKPGVLSIPQVVPSVVLVAGGTGSGKILSGSFDFTTTVYVVKRPQELTS